MARGDFFSTSVALRVSGSSTFDPDAMVLPVARGQDSFDDPGLAILAEPPLLAVDVWSRSAGSYDLNAKLAVYRQRGNLEIRRILPYERSLPCWVRQADGSDHGSIHHGGIVVLVALPDVEIDLDWLFAGGLPAQELSALPPHFLVPSPIKTD